MANVTYDRQLAALLVIDPYNDFISEGGKIWPREGGGASKSVCAAHVAGADGRAEG
jgi:ureidoacrylate peracid hydrolase